MDLQLPVPASNTYYAANSFLLKTSTKFGNYRTVQIDKYPRNMVY